MVIPSLQEKVKKLSAICANDLGYDVDENKGTIEPGWDHKGWAKTKIAPTNPKLIAKTNVVPIQNH